MKKIDAKKENFLKATEYIKQLGSGHESAGNDDSYYTDDIKNILDERYNDYKNGIDMVDQDESRRKIHELLASI